MKNLYFLNLPSKTTNFHSNSNKITFLQDMHNKQEDNERNLRNWHFLWDFKIINAFTNHTSLVNAPKSQSPDENEHNLKILRKKKSHRRLARHFQTALKELCVNESQLLLLKHTPPPPLLKTSHRANFTMRSLENPSLAARFLHSSVPSSEFSLQCANDLCTFSFALVVPPLRVVVQRLLCAAANARA